MTDEELVERIKALEVKVEVSKILAEQIKREVDLATSILTQEDTFRALNNIAQLIKVYLDKYGKK